MDSFGLVISETVRLLKTIHLNISGFSFSLWDMMLFAFLSGIVGFVIFGIYSER